MIDRILPTIQIILALLLITSVLLQQKGGGLGIAFGGAGNVYSTKRGIDKVLYRFTIIVSILFFGTGLLAILL